MSNGPYGQLVCRCGAVSLLVGGSPLGSGQDAGGETVAFWSLSAIQVGQGADDVDVSKAGQVGGEVWRCRRCGESLLHAHEESGVAILEGEDEEADGVAPSLSQGQRRWLASLGYRVAPLA